MSQDPEEQPTVFREATPEDFCTAFNGAVADGAELWTVKSQERWIIERTTHSVASRSARLRGWRDSGPPRDRRSGTKCGDAVCGDHRSARSFRTGVADLGATAGATRSA